MTTIYKINAPPNRSGVNDIYLTQGEANETCDKLNLSVKRNKYLDANSTDVMNVIKSNLSIALMVLQTLNVSDDTINSVVLDSTEDYEVVTMTMS